MLNARKLHCNKFRSMWLKAFEVMQITPNWVEIRDFSPRTR
ncbi:hypothetical protein HMPREF3216_00997 [Gardnerella vaginalis]|uniref:Uncharacterized protein n=1 Tax=Gardnerella vaginalis TaxID=2702 RepID=A0A133NND1_GARVA|nr:hypothetical protein HMPREF3216_00997 [Gardnerella vaginalis]